MKLNVVRHTYTKQLRSIYVRFVLSNFTTINVGLVLAILSCDESEISLIYWDSENGAVSELSVIMAAVLF